MVEGPSLSHLLRLVQSCLEIIRRFSNVLLGADVGIRRYYKFLMFESLRWLQMGNSFALDSLHAFGGPGPILLRSASMMKSRLMKSLAEGI